MAGLLAGCAGGPATPPAAPRPASPASSTPLPDAAGPSSSGVPAPSVDDQRLRAAIAALQSRHAAPIGLAIAGRGSQPVTAGTVQTGPAWSTTKVPVAIAAAAGPDSSGLDDELRRAIARSDNAAADALYSRLGTPQQAARATEAVLRDGGDRRTTVPLTRKRPEYSVYGQTQWRLDDQARFAATLPCRAEAAPVLELMGQVSKDQRWGLGTVPRARFKGGWGPAPDGDYLVRQLGVLPAGSGHVGVAIAVDDVDFATGTRILDEVAAVVADSPELGQLATGC